MDQVTNPVQDLMAEARLAFETETTIVIAVVRKILCAPVQQQYCHP